MTSGERQALLDHFREEADEHCAALSQGFLALESGSADPQAVADLLRRTHSLKGAARLVGATTIERLAHALEAVLAEVRARRLVATPALVDVALRALDGVRQGAARLPDGATDDGAENVLGDLVALASQAPGLDDLLSALLPGLDAEVRDVLTEFQKSQLLIGREAGKACWEATIEATETELAKRLERVQAGFQDVAEVVSVSGLSAAHDGRLRFKFVFLTRLDEQAVRTRADRLAVRLTNPAVAVAPTPEPAAPMTADEAAFAEEMAKLVAQYVSETAEEVDAAAALILALESDPGNADTLNRLFRTAHSLKGSGMTYGLAAVSRVAHQMETVLDALRSGRLQVSAAVTDALLQGADTLKELFVEAREGGVAEDRPLPVLRVLEQVVEGDAAAASAGDPARVERPRAPRPAAAAAAPIRAESIRVRLDKLDRLVNLAGELTIGSNSRDAAMRSVERQADVSKAVLRDWQTLREQLQLDATALAHLRSRGHLDRYEHLGQRLANLGDGLEELLGQFSTTTLHAGTATAALQDAVMRIRMVPVSSLFDTAPRLIRDLTTDGDKRVHLAVSGESTEVDKRVLEVMADPLMHLLRNAVDHGIETVAERRGAGKPATATVALSAEYRAGGIVITVRDDGRGLDAERLLAKAVARRLVSESDAGRMTAAEAHALIFMPGFSTRDQVTAVSGRGVGMDVVRTSVDSLKGRIEIETEPGRGTTFRLYLPLSISVIQVVVVEVSGNAYCMPTASIVEVIRFAEDDVRSEDDRACVPFRGRMTPVVRLSAVLGRDDVVTAGADGVVVMARGLEGTIGFLVDRASQEQTVVVKEVGGLIRHAPHVAGATVLEGGRVALILDVATLITAAVRGGSAWTRPAAVRAPDPVRRRVLVADDSLTTRELLRSLLETAGYTVVSARHGREAWTVLQDADRVDAVVSDISMPEMDGYELTMRIKGDARFARLPVVLVTSLDKPEEKMRGLQVGADAYVVKGSFDQAGLLGRLRELVGAGA